MMPLRILIILTSIIFAQFAYSQDEIEIKSGLSITDDRGVKYFIPLTPAINFHIDIYYSQNKSQLEGKDYSYFSSTLGLRKYSSTQSSFRYFWDFDFSIGWRKPELGSYEVVARVYEIFYGIEYLIHDKFGIEGKFGTGATLTPDRTTNKNSLYFSAPRHALAINYYFD